MKKIIFTVTVVLLVIAFGVSAFLVGEYLINSKKEQNSYADLATLTYPEEETTSAPTTAAETADPKETTDGTEPAETTEATEPTEPKILKEFQARYDKNNDMVGWIRLEDPENPEKPWMDYPVMQTPKTKDYYLKRNFEKKYSEWGSIYAWEKADINKPSDNVTLFGHNMTDGSMFACLHKYLKQETWEKNPWIFYHTLYEYHTYKIFAVFKTTAEEGKGFPYHRFVDAANEEEFNDFVAECKKLSFYETGVTPKYGDKLICLSTCEYTDPWGNGRLVVAAVRWDF